MDTKQLRQKILDLAIHGKLVPQDPNDEPASVLLERIREEKKRLAKEGKIKESKKSAKTSDTPHYEQVPFEVPKGWKWTTLKEITSKIGSGSTPKGSDYSNDGILFFRSQNVYNDGIVLEDIKYISEDTHRVMKGTEVLPKDLLLNITGGSLGRCAIVPDEITRGNVSQHVCIIRPIMVKFEYLHAFILSSLFRKTMKITGSGREGLPKYNLEKMYLPLPPLREQKAIVNTIEQWFSLIDNIEQEKTDLQIVIKQSRTKILDLAIHGKLVPQDPNDEPAIELLKRINPGFTPCDNAHNEKLPRGWYYVRLGEIAEYINGRAFKPEEWETDGLPIIRIQNLNSPDAEYNYSTKTFEDKYLINNGDLLFAWAASLGTYIWSGGNAWLNQHIFKVKPYDCVEKMYLHYCLEQLISEFYEESHGSGMVHITRKKFESIMVALPPLREQRCIVERIEELFAILDTIQASLAGA